MNSEKHEDPDTTHHDDVQTALDEARASCEHISDEVFFEGLAEMIGTMVKRDEIGREQVYQYLESALPPPPPPENVCWQDL